MGAVLRLAGGGTLPRFASGYQYHEFLRSILISSENLSELIEDKPIDLQHAEEIPDDDLSASKAANQDRRRSVSSNK